MRLTSVDALPSPEALNRNASLDLALVRFSDSLDSARLGFILLRAMSQEPREYRRANNSDDT